MDVMTDCLPFVSVTKMAFDGVATGYDQVNRLVEVINYSANLSAVKAF